MSLTTTCERVPRILVAGMRDGNRGAKETAVAEEWYTWKAKKCEYSVTRVKPYVTITTGESGSAEMRRIMGKEYRVPGTRVEGGPCPAVQGIRGIREGVP